ncbi:MAG: glycoside hydrolase family 99-like domain-containing protein [Prevotella sp.]|nr:glycoside hydrolase family 99-like domain-containing protein [Prevotella sp.]
MSTRIIAFYLPQFHSIPENDEWWGKGFTDWVNVKKARPLFKGHQQPRIPLNENYYDLSKVDTLQWQAKIANEYGVYGFCFYHYWFNGKLLLEKPAEMLLADKSIALNFCFSWANEPWARTWDGKAKQVLMPQSYGGKDDWEKHFYYLLPFFKDERYIKENNCPMFLIYRSCSIPCAAEMMEEWNEMAKKAGFNGIHFVETLRNGKREKRNLPFKAKVEFEPARTNMQQHPVILNYKRVRRRIINIINNIFHCTIPLNKPFPFVDVAQRSIEKKSPVGTYGGVFIGWDNTPRRGLAGTIVLPPSKAEFKQYFKTKMEQTLNVYHTNYVFINAWNEWAEGTVLEPDETHQYEYLEAIKESII